ncbi:DUF3887 domain-containing protein [Nonomuraea sp. KC401]|nr:DUF3887 domain-containing protein [Nonomuraea sp. KC401]
MEPHDTQACRHCGRALPSRSGQGRRREYCDSTCRSAARRARDRREHVKESLTPLPRQGHIYEATETPAATGLEEAARRLMEQLSTTPTPLDAVAAAHALARLVDHAMRAEVARARTAGHTWQEIGDVLGSSRQAAFQRFSRPLDPRTGTPMTEKIMPDASDRAAALIADLIETRWEDACRDFDETMAADLGPARLAAVWAQVIGTVGGYEGMGEPAVHQAGDHTVVNVPLSFEAGDLAARVSYDRDGKVSGFYLTPPSTL